MHFEQYWHQVAKGSVYSALISTAEAIMNEQTRKLEDFRRYASMYKSYAIIGFEPGDWKRTYDDLEAPVSYNVVRSCIDTLTSKITLHKPTPKFLTSGGTEDQQEKAKLMEKFVDGIIYQERVYEKAVNAFRDGCIYGLGALKVFAMEGGVRVERVHPNNIIVDNNGSLDGNPRFLIQRAFMTKGQLAAMFPNKRKLLENVPTEYSKSSAHVIRDLVRVYEAWSLPCGKEVGRHAIVVDGVDLVDEEWQEEEFPFVFIKYSDDLMGWYGIGLAEQLEGIQVEINVVVDKIQKNMNLLAVPYILKHKSSNIPDEHIGNNEDAKIIEWEGSIPPKVETPPAVHPQVFQYLSELYNKAYEISGISQLSASAQKPAGLNSGIAIRTYHDIETQRFSPAARRWEQLFVDIAKLMVKCARQIALEDEEAGYEVKVPEGSVATAINWADISLEEDAFVTEVYPASSLPQTPSGRLERVVEMIQAGMINPDEARQLLDFPDLEKYNRLATAAMDDLEAVFEHMLGKGDYIEPLVYQNLQMGIKLGTSYYLRAKLDGVKQSRLDLIARWLQEASDLLSPPPPPPAAPPMPGVAGPTVVPPPVGPTGAPMEPGILKPGAKVVPGMLPPELGVPPVPQE